MTHAVLPYGDLEKHCLYQIAVLHMELLTGKETVSPIFSHLCQFG